MKTFEAPKIEIIRLQNTDIITSSPDTKGREIWDDFNDEEGGEG